MLEKKMVKSITPYNPNVRSLLVNSKPTTLGTCVHISDMELSVMLIFDTLPATIIGGT